MNGDPKLYRILDELNIQFDYYEHPPAPTIEIAMQYWKDVTATHCKNLFFRNHKGDRHYLVILECSRILDIHDLEKRLKQGKISFASEQRMQKYLGIKPGSVSPFGIINDVQHHVHTFFDISLKAAEKISFHPNINTASIVLKFTDFIRFMQSTGNSFEFLELYETS
jgi:Ala-tRNA(Pro) deacylase